MSAAQLTTRDSYTFVRAGRQTASLGESTEALILQTVTTANAAVKLPIMSVGARNSLRTLWYRRHPDLSLRIHRTLDGEFLAWAEPKVVS